MKKIGACLLWAGWVSAAVAQTNAPAERALSLQDCITEALEHNFDVQVQRYEPLKSRYGLELAYAGYDPTLNLSATHSHNDAGGLSLTNGIFTTEQNTFKTDLGGSLPLGTTYDLAGDVASQYEPYPEQTGGQVGVSVTQPLLKNFWMDNTRLAVSAAKNQVKYSEQGLRQQLITTITAVENAYFELVFAREDLEVKRQALEVAQTQLDQDRQKAQVGSLALLDGTLQQDEAQVAQDRADLIAAGSTLGTDLRTLKNLITDQYSSWYAEDVRPTTTLEAALQLFDLQDSWNKGMTLRPDLLQARLNLEQDGMQLKYDRNQLFPALDLKASYGLNGAGVGYSDTFNQYGAGNRPAYSYGAQVSVPLSNAKARNSYKTDKANQQQDLLKLKQLEQNILVGVDNAVGVAKSDYEGVLASQQARVYAQAALDAEQKKYAVGKSTTFTVLQLQNKLTAARSSEIRALANYQEALTALAQAEGSTLERRKVDVELKKK